MDKIQRFFNKVLAFVDKNSTIVILLCVVAFGAKYFTDIFKMFSDGKDEKAKLQEEHAQVLTSEKAPFEPKTGDVKKDKKIVTVINPAIARNNAKIESLKFDATMAENIRSYTKTIPDNITEIFYNNHPYKLMELAKTIKKYQGNMTTIAAEYKKAFNDDLYADVRSVMGSQYITWLSTASNK